MIKNIIINNSINLIEQLNKYDKTQIEEIKYGLESIYLLLTKVIVILTLSAILKILKEALLFLVIFNMIRATAFGLHASKSIWCWISSSITFLVIPAVSKFYLFPNIFYLILPIMSLLIIAVYSPADTIKRPLINIKKRKMYKILSIIITLIYLFLIIYLDNTLFKNLLMFALILESILILPITYKIFKLPYNNYKKYNK